MGQLYVSNFEQTLTLYREGGVNFIGVFQNASAQIEGIAPVGAALWDAEPGGMLRA